MTTTGNSSKPGRKRCSIGALPSAIKTAAVLLLFFGSGAQAQSDNRIALGANISLRDSTDTSIRGRDGIGLLCRFGSGDTGWGWDWALNWVSVDVVHLVGGSAVQLGELNLRPVMVGYSYDYRHGRELYFASVVGGYAFVSMSLTPGAIDAYHDRLGAHSVRVETPNTLVMRPEVGVWHDLADRVGLNISASFLLARPRVTIRTATDADERRIRADLFQIRVGVVYSIF
jgi:hypothetical protein